MLDSSCAPMNGASKRLPAAGPLFVSARRSPSKHRRRSQHLQHGTKRQSLALRNFRRPIHERRGISLYTRMPDFRPIIRTTTSPEEWRSQIAELRSRLAASGLAIPPGSRIEAFELANDAFTRDEIGAADHRDVRLHHLVAGARDVSELYTAATWLLPTTDRTVLDPF